MQFPVARKPEIPLIHPYVAILNLKILNMTSLSKSATLIWEPDVSGLNYCKSPNVFLSLCLSAFVPQPHHTELHSASGSSGNPGMRWSLSSAQIEGNFQGRSGSDPESPCGSSVGTHTFLAPTKGMLNMQMDGK